MKDNVYVFEMKYKYVELSRWKVYILNKKYDMWIVAM